MRFQGLHVAALLLGLMSFQAHAGEVAVAVTSNFAAPMERIRALFQIESGHTIRVSLGSTGKFYSQIQNGAPFDVLIAADEVTPQRLEQAGLAVSGTRFVYALGTLVLWSARPGVVDARGEVLRNGSYTRLAIADPKLASYGMAAKQTLQGLGLWNVAQGKLVMGENITQTWQFAATGNAELGFVALSQIMQDGRVAKGSWWKVTSNLYQPIRQSAVLLTGAKNKPSAKAFLDFMKSEKAVAVIRSFGYELP
ncbi:MAG: molybdate ABC transporter substrate-binding protein [Sideroxyarcus sp.]|nr:molybdate ABC transporter substrate-binding protein [Sideroxyarcus sp.]